MDIKKYFRRYDGGTPPPMFSEETQAQGEELEYMNMKDELPADLIENSPSIHKYRIIERWNGKYVAEEYHALHCLSFNDWRYEWRTLQGQVVEYDTVEEARSAVEQVKAARREWDERLRLKGTKRVVEEIRDTDEVGRD